MTAQVLFLEVPWMFKTVCVYNFPYIIIKVKKLHPPIGAKVFLELETRQKTDCIGGVQNGGIGRPWSHLLQWTH